MEFSIPKPRPLLNFFMSAHIHRNNGIPLDEELQDDAEHDIYGSRIEGGQPPF
jgi:hypothetical protein